MRKNTSAEVIRYGIVSITWYGRQSTDDNMHDGEREAHRFIIWSSIREVPLSLGRLCIGQDLLGFCMGCFQLLCVVKNRVVG